MFKHKKGKFYVNTEEYYSDEYNDYYSSDYKSYSKDKTPKILHQTWKCKELPENLENWRNMWLKMCPDYDHVLHDDDDIEAFMKQYFPEYIKDFNNFTYNIERVDFWRCAVLYVHGGVYADLDVFPLKSIDIWLEKNKIVLGREPIEHARLFNGSDFLLCNAFMISPKKNHFWIDMMDYILKNYKHNYDPVFTTGPGIMTKMYKEHPEKFKDVIITEPNNFYPITFNKSKKTQEYEGTIYKNVSNNCDMKDAFVVHMWEGSWINGGIGGINCWGLSMIAMGGILFLFLVLLFSLSIGSGRLNNTGGIKNYEIMVTVTSLIILGIIFLVFWLDNTEDKELEKDYQVLSTDFIEIENLNFKYEKIDFFNISLLKMKKYYEGVIRGSESDYSYPFYIKLSNSGKVEKLELIKLNYKDMKGCDKNGLEDPKIFIFRNEKWVAGNFITYKNNCINQMCLFKLKDPKNTFLVLEPPIDKKEIQKNWTFFENKGDLLCEYSLSPHIIFKIDTKTGKCKELSRTSSQYIPVVKIKDNNARLNANPIYLEKEKVYLGIGHIRGNCDYLHFFYTFDNNYPFKILNISKEFKLENKEKIQFVGGISEYKNNIYVSYGIDDNHNKISIFTIDEVFELLEN